MKLHPDKAAIFSETKLVSLRLLPHWRRVWQMPVVATTGPLGVFTSLAQEAAHRPAFLRGVALLRYARTYGRMLVLGVQGTREEVSILAMLPEVDALVPIESPEEAAQFASLIRADTFVINPWQDQFTMEGVKPLAAKVVTFEWEDA